MALVFLTKDVQVAGPEHVGHLWTGKSGDSWLLCYITAEERARQQRVSPGRNSSYTTDMYYRYRLHVRTLPDGAIAHEILLGDAKRSEGRPAPQIVGVVGDVLWLWHHQLEARALPNLEVRGDEAALRRTDPAAADLMPREVTQFKVLTSPAGLVIRGRDARFYLVDPVRFALTPVAATDLPSTTFASLADNRFDFITTPAQGRRLTSPHNQMKQHLLTRDGLWFGLLSESERDQQPTWITEDSQPSGNVARSLYRASYKRDDRYAVIDPKAVTRTGEASFVQGGFLLRHGWTPWQVAEPASALVLAKRRLGAAEPWDVIRLTLDGRVAWQASTGLSDPGEFIDAGPYFVVAGRPLPNSVDGPKADKRERIVWIDEATGAKVTLLVATGEVTK